MLVKAASMLIIKVKNYAFAGSLVPKLLLRFFSSTPLARIYFNFSIWLKVLLCRKGELLQRAVEYPWVLSQLKDLRSGSTILDAGCSDSLLSHELASCGYRVVGIDIRDYPLKGRGINFVKGNLLKTGLPSEFFDAVIIVSTIEHVGLRAYGQLDLDDEGDLRAIKEVGRILKKGGKVILTVPYVGRASFTVSEFERRYNRTRLNKLIQGFTIIREDYFYPFMTDEGGIWVRVDRNLADKIVFTKPGVACLVLKKE